MAACQCLLCEEKREPQVTILEFAICPSCYQRLLGVDGESYDQLLEGLLPLAKQIIERAS